jgi:NADPH:quinone reductase
MSRMKEATVHKTEDGTSIEVKINEVEIPRPALHQLVIKVVVSGSNPKDWKLPFWLPNFDGTNTGDDIAGYVHSVGDGVTDFRPGDRVAALHELMKPDGSFAEYAIAWEHTTFHLPATISFEEGATIPLAAMTAVVALFCRLGLPEPWLKTDAARAKCKGGVVIYGAACAIGAYAVKLLQKSDIHPIICVAGRGKDFVEKLIDRSKGDTIVDYRDGDDAVVEGLKKSVPPGERLRYAFDAVSENGSFVNISKILDVEGGNLTVVTPGANYEAVPKGVNLSLTNVDCVHNVDKEVGCAWFKLFSMGLKEGWFSAHPHKVVSGGLDGVEVGLRDLKAGKASAVKYVFQIGEHQR